MIGFLWIEAGSVLASLREKSQLKVWTREVLASVSFLTSIYLSGKNSYVDLHYSLIGDPFLYYAGGILAVYAIVVLCESLPEHWMSRVAFLGENSLFIFATHMNLGIVPAVLSFLVMSDGWGKWLISTLLIVIVEIVMVLLVNRFWKELVSYQDFKRKILNRIPVFYVLFVGGGAFLLAQYAKYLWMETGLSGDSNRSMWLLAVNCFLLAVCLPFFIGMKVRKQWIQRQQISDKTEPNVSIWKLFVSVLTGNAIWYVLLCKTMEIFPFQVEWIGTGSIIGVIGISVVQCAWVCNAGREKRCGTT